MRGAALIVLAACYSPHAPAGSVCGPDGLCPEGLVCAPATHTCETSSGNGPDGPPGSTCYGSGLLKTCFDAPPTGDLELAGAIDTSTDPRCEVIGGNCVLAADIATLGAMRVIGTRPVVVVGVTSIVVGDLVDVASHAGAPGAGADPTACVAQQPPTLRGGGAGGSFGGRGGNGGLDTTTGIGGVASAASAPSTLRGGCPGGAGGGTTPKPGGSGGGAIYLVSNGTITIAGTIDASGAGGRGGATTTGGSGGGSGGMIGLDAPTIALAPGGAVFANGGGGGEGGGGTVAGAPGDDPAMPAIPAAGGTGATMGAGDGGIGAAGSSLAGGVAGDGVSGGGGGGGAGVIEVFPTHTFGSAVSPPPS